MDRRAVEEAVSATARLSLWLVDELEPISIDVAEQDLDLLYDLCIAVERKGRESFPDKWDRTRD